MASTDDADRWLHDLTVDEAARRRAEQGDLARLAWDDATLADGIAGIAVDGRAPVLGLAGTSVTGAVLAIGHDYAELAGDGTHTLVALAAVLTVEAGAPTIDLPGPAPRSATRLMERLRLEAGTGRRLDLRLVDGRTVSGRLDAVGADVLVVDRRPDSAPIHLAGQSLALVSG